MLTMPDLPAHGIDFAKVEMLRRHMLLSVSDMAKVFGVSRVTYYSWVRGGKIRITNVPKVKRTLKKLLAILQSGWPSDKVLEMTQAERVDHILELLGQEQ